MIPKQTKRGSRGRVSVAAADDDNDVDGRLKIARQTRLPRGGSRGMSSQTDPASLWMQIRLPNAVRWPY